MLAAHLKLSILIDKELHKEIKKKPWLKIQILRI